jgi:hypothetical protein
MRDQPSHVQLPEDVLETGACLSSLRRSPARCVSRLLLAPGHERQQHPAAPEARFHLTGLTAARVWCQIALVIKP